MNKIKNKIIILTSVSIAVIVILIYFVIIPMTEQVRSLDSQINNELGTLFPAGQAQVMNPTKQYHLVLEELENYSLLLKKTDALVFIDSLENLANSYQLEQSINLSNVSALTEDNGVQTIVLELSIRGNLTDTMEYLAELEKLDSYINFEQFSIYRTQSNTIPVFGEEFSESAQPESAEVITQIEANTFWN